MYIVIDSEIVVTSKHRCQLLTILFECEYNSLRIPRFRNFDEKGRPRNLNEEGRKEVAKVFLGVAEKYPEALGYNIEELKEKLKKVIRE